MYKLIIIDDERDTRETVAGFFDWESLGICFAGTAGDGVHGLELITRVKPDIVLIDINMPQMTGLEVIEAMGQGPLAPSFVIITGHAEFEYARKAMRLMVDEYLLKPFSPDDILAVIHSSMSKLTARRMSILRQQHSLFSSEQATSTGVRYPVNAERMLINQLLTGTQQGVEAELEQFIQEICRDNSQHGALMCATMLCTRVLRILMERGKSFTQRNQAPDCPEGDWLADLRRELFAFAMDAYISLCDVSHSNAIVLRATAYLEAHYTEDIGLESAASALSVSAPYLSSLFSKSMGISFVSYLNKIRVERAKTLLSTGDDDIATIAERSGYKDVKYFCQTFKRYSDYTPTQFRRQSRGAVPVKQEEQW